MTDTPKPLTTDEIAEIKKYSAPCNCADCKTIIMPLIATIEQRDAEIKQWRDAANLSACEADSSVGLEELRQQLKQRDEQIEKFQGAIEDAIDTLEAMDLHVDNPLYERLRATLESPSEALAATEPVNDKR